MKKTYTSILTSAAVASQLAGVTTTEARSPAIEDVEQEHSSSHSVVRRGFNLGIDGAESKKLANAFVDNPVHFLAQMGLNLQEAACPERVHIAFARGEAFAQDAKAKFEESSELTIELIQQIKSIAASHFGNDVEVELIPYGLKFVEKMEIPEDSGTATASGTVTFADSDADADG